ncbi:zinc-binding alcohol dehydrogenase family protein [Streptomyces sp. ISL-11]|uniref:quinone oxidoreductase family protein n=1 Tax=Streptomyces sp. ISL-11 TaxID=2819174 RepID=UPI001BE7B723|nr:zinc-binding alcohol dehydrogenase family protein [Streptomyces sp. ISL-11]MBT2383885.1 zinc-binding alcohol dehydrogenase family protein [Streptomyces sp. ISL-11]
MRKVARRQMRAVMATEPGGPEVLEVVRVPEPEPRPDHELVMVTMAGVNPADILMRENQWLGPIRFPFVPGRELVGVLDDGRRIAGLTSSGAYAQRALVERGLYWEIPDELTDEDACGLTLDGLTAWHLLHTALRIERYEVLVVSDAASAVGCLAIQLAKSHGAFVVAMDRGKHRLQAALDLGADAIVDCSETDGLIDRIREATGGLPIDAALDLVGGDIFPALFQSLRFRGRIVVDGCSSRNRGDIAFRDLVFGSKSIIGFWLPNLFTDLHAIHNSIHTIFAAKAIGALSLPVEARYMLDDVRWAHRTLVPGNPSHGYPGKTMLNMIGYYY